MLKKLIYSLIIITNSAYSQNNPVSIGNWRIHLNYQNAKQIAEVKDKIYCATSNGLFSYKKDGGNTERLSPINGFYGYNVNCMHYVENKDMLIIAYNGGTIEVIKDNVITQNEDIKRATFIIGDKKVNHINTVGDFAYFSTSFGLMEYNLLKNEFRNNYTQIGPGSTQIEVFSSAILHDSIFVSTRLGILKSSFSDVFKNWTVSKPATAKSTHIASFNDHLYAELDSQLFVYKNGGWSFYENSDKVIISNITVCHDKMVVGVFGKHIITEDNAGNKTYTQVNILNQCIIDNKGNYWYASPFNGLVLKSPNGEINFYPNGPRAKDNFSFVNADNKLYCSAGAFSVTTYAPNFNINRFYTFDNFNWQDMPQNPITDTLYDFTHMVFNKNNKHLFVGTHSKGLLEFENGSLKGIYEVNNSPLQKRKGLFCIISGLALDKGNNLWVSNYGVEDSALLQFSNKGKWTRYLLPVTQAGKISIDSRDNKWIITPRTGTSTGIVYFNDKGTPAKTDDLIVPLSTNKGNGNLPSNYITALAFTKDGELLVGSDLGYGRIRTPNNIITGENYDFERIIISVEEGTNLGGYLLGSEFINCITLDGADRRWIGTNTGAWLLDKDGETIIHHFTMENSPLLSNNVNCIGIMEETGEVFFGTDNGIISYRGDALTASKDLKNIKIYPNPVRPDFDGEIAITGLDNNTLVKITDINGQLVYQTTSNGGMATWNCRTFDGTRPATGVYLAFCVNSDGSQTGMGKILFIK